MKKVSTASGKATKNFPQPKLTIGLDLGDRSSSYCLLDEVGEVLQVRYRNRTIQQVFPRKTPGATRIIGCANVLQA